VQEIQPDIVFHLAAHPDGRESGEQTYAVLQHNLAGLANLLEALRELPSVALVYGDSAKVYGNSGVPYRSYQPVEPLSTYAVSKAAGWGLIDVYRRVHGIEAVGLRPTLVYGPAQGFNLFSFLANAISSGSEEIALDGGAQTRDPVYVDDAVSAFIAAGNHCSSLNGRNLPLSGGREISVLELAELTVRLLGGQQRVVCRPTKVRPTETMRSWCDNTEISSELGWTPSTSLEEGILRTADFLGVRATSPSFTEQA
jgi:nucleoside-diphosphate-sugar epimerase